MLASVKGKLVFLMYLNRQVQTVKILTFNLKNTFFSVLTEKRNGVGFQLTFNILCLITDTVIILAI